MKKRASASKRAVAELLSNSTDNNKDARGRETSVIDKRAELKKELFGSAESFGELSPNEFQSTVSKAEASADIKKEQTENMAPVSDAGLEKRKASPVAVAQEHASTNISVQKRAQNAQSAPKQVPTDINAKKQDAVRGASGVLSGADTGKTMSEYGAMGKTAVKTAPDIKAQTAQITLERLSADETASLNIRPDGAKKDGKTSNKKGKAGRKIAAVVASVLALLVVAAASATVYLYVNREEEFIPADMTAGVMSADTAEYSELLSDTTVEYLTEDRYNIKFTFYQTPEIVCTTPEITVGELMEKLGITLGEDNRCSMTSDSVLSADGTVDIQTLSYETVSTEEAIPYETEYVDVRTIPKGSTKVSKNGKNGVKTYTYKCTLVNGVEESRELVSEEVTTKPTTRIMYRGVGGTVTSQGKTYNYSYYIDVNATVYNIVGSTALGLPTSTSVMAVDPRVIPLGTKCVVTGGGGDYGYRIAADTGGSIKGNKIDLWYPAGTFSGFGWRSTRVYILE